MACVADVRGCDVVVDATRCERMVGGMRTGGVSYSPWTRTLCRVPAPGARETGGEREREREREREESQLTYNSRFWR